MKMNDSTIVHKPVGGMQIASIKSVIEKRADIMPLFERLYQACGDAVCGPAMTIFHYGSVKDGLLVEVAYPVSRPVETGEVHTQTLEKRRAWTLMHRGAHDTIRASTRKILEYIDAHAGSVGGGTREIYLTLDPAHPENNLSEIQVLDHEWHERLAGGVEEILGQAARQQVMAGVESITTGSSAETYREWVHTAMARIDELTGDPGKKYQIVSCCAHVFPQHRIDHLRSIYEQHHEIDDVLREMYQDPDWYEDPVRKGNQLYMRKVPYDAETYKKATSPIEQRQAYCHCGFVRPYLTESPARISPTFCLCGAGWYRRLWEGILGQPIQVEHVETLVTGSDCCRLVITLPITAEGELSPDMVRTNGDENGHS
jgi:effector-binding domain-containing protein